MSIEAGSGKRRISVHSSSPTPSGSDSGISVENRLLDSPKGSAYRRSSTQVEKGQADPRKSLEKIDGDIREVNVQKLDEGVNAVGGKVVGVVGGKKGRSLPFLLLQVSTFQTIAGPIGFLALRHISFPTMVLGKVSCQILLCCRV